MSYAGSSSKKLVLSLEKDTQATTTTTTTTTTTNTTTSPVMTLDEEMVEIDCRKRTVEKDGSLESAVQVPAKRAMETDMGLSLGSKD